MSKRVNVSVPDDLYSWLSAEAEKMGLPVATFVLVLVNESKRFRAEKDSLSALSSIVGQLSADQLREVVSQIGIKELPDIKR